MHFIKAQGLGNDFVMLVNPDIVESSLSNMCKFLADRRYGVGCDQVIIAQYDNIDIVNIRFFNADGSEAESCGNGSRCIAKYLMKHFNIPDIRLRTISGDLSCRMTQDEAVEVDMPFPSIEVLTSLNEVEGFVSDPKMTSVKVGNPHLICFVEDTSVVHKYGGKYENHDYFMPQRTNVEFAKVISRSHIELIVWERGCGVTPACGSGACATTVAAIHHNLVDNEVTVSQPGGDLVVSWNGETLSMKGPGEMIFTGDIDVKM
jgi:diaminopimelate epimerase